MNQHVVARTVNAITKGTRCWYLGGVVGLMAVMSSVYAASTLPLAISLNMKGAEITAFIGTVAKQTGKNFIVDPRVKGKVNIISHQPLDERALYQVFLTVLEVHGFTAVPAGGNTFKIVPIADAKHSGAPAVSPEEKRQGAEQITRVIEIKHVSATQLVPILRPLVPPQGHLAAYPPSNMLIISDSALNIERLLSIIARIDQKTSDEIEVISLEHASSSEVVRILSSLDKAQATKKEGGSTITLVADERTNSVILSGDPATRLRMRAIITHLDTPLDSGGNIHVIYLKYAKAKDLVGVLTGVGKTAQQQGGQKVAAAPPSNRTDLTIQADESSNALVITAAPDVMRSINSVVKKLDVRRAQVMVEAIIAEILVNRSAELGVQWVVADRNKNNVPVGVSNFPGGNAPGIVNLGTAIASETLTGGLGLGSGITFGIGKIGDGVLNFAALVNALKGDGTSNILSTPSLVTLDNIEAEINVGQEVPFITGSFTNTGGTGGAANPFQTIQRKNVGISLKVKPQINDGDAIRMDIEQKIDSLSASSIGAADLITNTRSIKTSVMVNDGQTLVLGGLIKEDMNQSEQRVPILGDIPIIGALFRKTKSSKDKTNLMVFLRPRILRDTKGNYEVSSEKYNYFRGKQLEMRKKGAALMRDNEIPVLPELKALEEMMDMSKSEGEDEIGGADKF